MPVVPDAVAAWAADCGREKGAVAEETLRAVAERGFANALPSHGDPLLGGASELLRRLAAEPA